MYREGAHCEHDQEDLLDDLETPATPVCVCVCVCVCVVHEYVCI